MSEEIDWGDWLPIEQAPRDGTYVILCNVNARSSLTYIGAYRSGNQGEPWANDRQWRDYYGRYATPTHFMPLPDVPRPKRWTPFWYDGGTQ